ncbi:MAG: precorrin-3B C(17)-methyltransferase [Candidatus Methanoplasma sp.]|jgi:precorrin-3B C17-methyltransferase|nr:precorrin-3B C(17)-methyltransferase [Candidatus Methanoplasma sp.]
MTGKLTVVGFGPGNIEDMTHRAYAAIRDADVVTGYTTYIDLLRPFFPGKDFKATGMTGEVERCRSAVRDAVSGLSVAMVSSGDAGIYGMAGIIYQLADEMGAEIEINVVPGVSAAFSAAALLGAPLVHDTALISLSDCLTPLDVIMKRVEHAGASDMIVALYNPRSSVRPDTLSDALSLLLRHRSAATPVGIVRNAGREGCAVKTTTLGEFDDSAVDMFCTIIIGNSQTYTSNGKMITPRGYDVGGCCR